MPGLRTRRYAQALAEALRAVDLLGLDACRRWLHRQAPLDYRWLEALEVGGPATPLDTLFSTLTTAQSDRLLEPFWLRLTRLGGQTPLWQGRAALVGLRLLPPTDPSRPSLAQALLRRGEDAALAAYEEAARRFPEAAAALAGHGHALLELHGPEAALPVLRAAVAAHGDHLPLRNDYTEALIQSGDLQEAGRQLASARRLAATGRCHDPKVDELAQRLEFARAGNHPSRNRARPTGAPARGCARAGPPTHRGDPVPERCRTG